jgi:Uma2 family endonuclease
MAVHSRPYLSPEEYLALERAAETKSEYLDGEMIAMSGVSRWHSLIVTNTVRELSSQLKSRPCEVHASDLRVGVSPTGLYTYPDLAVTCSEPRFEDEVFDTLLNPTLIAEVLSPSTESYDRGKKFEHYRTLDSLAEYLLISQDEMLVEQFVRQAGTGAAGAPGAWLFTATSGRDGVVSLSSLGCTLALAEIYDKVVLPAGPADARKLHS